MLLKGLVALAAGVWSIDALPNNFTVFWQNISPGRETYKALDFDEGRDFDMRTDGTNDAEADVRFVVPPDVSHYQLQSIGLPIVEFGASRPSFDNCVESLRTLPNRVPKTAISSATYYYCVRTSRGQVAAFRILNNKVIRQPGLYPQMESTIEYAVWPGGSSSSGGGLGQPGGGSGQPTPVGGADPQAPNFSVIGAGFERKHSGSLYNTITIHNHGPGTAHVKAQCGWTCPGGNIISGGSLIINGGYLRAGNVATYSNIASNMCVGPPALLDITCDVMVKGYGPDNNPGRQMMTRTWKNRVAVPLQ